MPSLRGVSFHRPDRERRRAWLVRVEIASLSLLISLSVSAQGAPERQAPAANTTQAALAPSPERPRVILLVRTENDEGVMNRVRAELRTSAWQILELRVDDRLAQLSLGKLAAQQAVRAAVRFDATDARIELWIFRPTGNVEEAIPGSGERDEDAVMALRITEELRARGLDLGPESAPSERAPEPAEVKTNPLPVAKPAAPSSAQRAPARAAATRSVTETEARPLAGGLWLELGPALGGSPGGLGPSVAAWASARLELTPLWSGSILGLVPVVAQRAEGPEGSAKVTAYLVGASVDVAWLRTPPWQASVSLGAAWAQCEMSGTASSGYIGGDATVSTLMPLARATAQLRLSERWRLGVGGLGGVALPEVSVKFGERLVGHWGRPAFFATIDLHWLAARLPTATDHSATP